MKVTLSPYVPCISEEFLFSLDKFLHEACNHTDEEWAITFRDLDIPLSMDVGSMEFESYVETPIC